MPRPLPSIVVLVLLAVAAPARRADAGTPTAAERRQGREHHEKGIAYYDLGQYDLAIAEFEKAYELTREPALLFNLAQAHRKREDLERALELYRSYLRLAPRAPNRRDVEARIAEVESAIEENRRLGAAPPVVTLPPPGDGAQAGGGPARGGAGPTADRPEPAAVRDPARPTAPGRTRRRLGLAVGGLGLAGVATGTYFGRRANDAQDELDDAAAGQQPWTPALQDTLDDGQRDARVATALTVAGATAALAGVGLYVWGALDGRAPERAPAVAITPGPGSIWVTGRF